MTFKAKKIFLDKETVAEQLRSTRQAKALKLTNIAKQIKVSFEYLEALENGNYHKIPKGIYGLNFLKEYALFLGLDYNKLRQAFLAEQAIYQPDKKNKFYAHQVARNKYFWAMPRLIKSWLIGLVALAFLIYLIFLLKNIFIAPPLKILSPRENLVTEINQILVNGQTEPEIEVLINRTQVMVDDEGKFSKEIDLKQGINKIVITAQRKGKQRTVVREVLVKNSQD